MYEEKYSIEPCYQMEKKDNKEDWEHALSPNLAQCEALGSPVVTIPISKFKWKQALGGSKF